MRPQGFIKNFSCRKCEGNFGEAVEQEEKSCYYMEAMKQFTYVGIRVIAGGGCSAAVIARTR